MQEYTNDHQHLSDSELLLLLKNGSKAAFQELYSRYWAILYLHAHKMLKDEHDAKDILQEVFAVLWAQQQTLNIRGPVSAYLYQVMRNRILNLFEKRKVRLVYSNLAQKQPQVGVLMVEEKFREKELARIIEAEIANLPPAMRKVFELSRTARLSHKQIAGQLEISDKTVKKQISNAIRILRLKISYVLLILLILQ